MTNQEKKRLKTLCHNLKPVVRIGQKGLSEAVVEEIELALDHHELIKIKITSADKASRQEMIDSICDQTNSDLIQSIGHIVAIFRKKQAIS